MTDLLALLDELDQAHAALPSGSWEVTDDVHRHGVHEYGIWTNEGEYGRYVVEVIPSQADAAAIVAAVNAVPCLTAALRAVAELAERLDDEAMYGEGGTQRRDAATRIRAALTAALTPGAAP